MISERELVARFQRLDITVLHQWIDLGLVSPHPEAGQYAFDEADVARVELMCELCFDMDLGQDSLPVILSLVDQLHDVRRTLRALAAAIGEQPEEVRTRITTHVKTTLSVGRKE